MSHMLHNKQIMKSAPIRQEPCLSGEHFPMLITIPSVCHIHPRTQTICIQLMKRRGHHYRAIVDLLGMVPTLVNRTQQGKAHLQRFLSSQVHSFQNRLNRRPDLVGSQSNDWNARFTRRSPTFEALEGTSEFLFC